jgi:hypothetical protein
MREWLRVAVLVVVVSSRVDFARWLSYIMQIKDLKFLSGCAARYTKH